VVAASYDFLARHFTPAKPRPAKRSLKARG
jgi:hypothetical protein